MEGIHLEVHVEGLVDADVGDVELQDARHQLLHIPVGQHGILVSFVDLPAERRGDSSVGMVVNWAHRETQFTFWLFSAPR
ncbi:hypothetical protein GCM10010349_42410 [Streptomyces flavofungini]|nr:hypothetical protein GCM10010349_42410 [Streptomyces flavofungini]